MSIEITQQELIELQDELLEVAKKNLDSSGHTSPVAHVFARKMNVDNWLRKTCMDMSTNKMVKDDGSDPGKYMVLSIPCFYDNFDLLMHMMAYRSDNPEEASRGMEMIRALGPIFDSPEDPTRTIRKVFNDMGLSGKNIVADFLKKVCRTTDALAYIKIEEIWMNQSPVPEGMTPLEYRKTLPDNLRDDPNSTEGVMCYMETKSLKRLIRQPFKRAERDVGKIVSWGMPETNVDDGSGNYRLMGRFCDLLQTPKETPKSQTSQKCEDQPRL